MDISKQINKECDEAKVMLMEALSQKKTGVRIIQAAIKTPYNPDTSAARALRIQTHTVMKESQRGGPVASMGTPYQLWEVAFKNKMMHDARQRLSPKDRSRLVTSEQMQLMMNLKEFK